VDGPPVVDPAGNFKGGDFSNICWSLVKSHDGFAAVREMKYTSQHCCDKTMEDKMAVTRECFF